MLELMPSQLTSQTCSYLVQALFECGAVAELRERLTDKRSAPRVAEARQAVVAAEEALLAAVAAERDRGVSWEAIGEALGITRSTAHGRFADRLEAADSGTDAERFLDRAWRRILSLAEKHLTPLTHSIGELGTEVRERAGRNLMAAAREPALPAETRVSAAQMLAAMEPGTHSEAMEKMLREAVAGSAMPRPVLPSHDDSRRAEETVSPARLLSLNATYAHAANRQGDENRTSLMLMSKGIEGLETLLRKRAAADADRPVPRATQERLAALLILRFDELENPDDLERAILHLRSSRSAADDSGRLGSAELLATALSRRYELRNEEADLAEATALFESVVSDTASAYRSDHPETFTARFQLAQLAVRSGDPARGSRLLGELLADQRRALEADHPEVFQTCSAYALSLSDCGEHARAEQILTDLAVRQARVLGIDHPNTSATRAHLLQVMVSRLSDAGDTELIERLDLAVWSVLTGALGGNHEPPWPTLPEADRRRRPIAGVPQPPSSDSG